MKYKLRIGHALLAAVSLLFASLAAAQGWPARPITLVVPFPPGGGTDAFARPLAVLLGKQLGRQIVIDNRGGAGGTVGASVAAKAAPDGYTFFVGAVHHAIAPSFYAKLDYDIEKDLVPLTVIAQPPQVVVVNPSRVPVADMKAFLGLLRSRPGKLNYASAGNGTSHHLAGELFKQQTKTFVVHIPYRGAGPALQDLIGGQRRHDVRRPGFIGRAYPGWPDQGDCCGCAEALAGDSRRAHDSRGGAAGLRRVDLVRDLGRQGNAEGDSRPDARRGGQGAAEPGTARDLAEPGLGDHDHEPGRFLARFLSSEIKRWAQVTKTSGAKLD